MEKFTSYVLNIPEGILKDGEKITIGKDKISVKLLRCLLSDKYYDEMLNIYLNKRNRINFNSTERGITTYSSYSLASISKALIVLSQNTKEFEKKRINTLIALNDYDAFKRLEPNEVYKCDIDGKEYELSLSEIVSFLELGDEEYRKALKRKYFKNGLSLEHALYIIKRTSYLYLDKYVFSPKFVDRIRDISHFKDVDIEALNELNETKSCWLDKTIVNQKLEEFVFNSIPSNLNLFEKALFVYILLCLIMTYDPYYFAYDEDSECNVKHKSINYISKINRNNNRLVCYEFSNIYGYFLSKLGINFEVFSSEDFYQYHSSVYFRVGKFLIYADSITSVLSGDLIRSKLGLPLVGLMLANKNVKTQKEFKNILDKVYALFNIPKIQVPSLEGKSVLERINAIILLANQYHLDITDKFALIYLCKKMFFTRWELDNLSYTVLRNNDKDSLLGIFTITDSKGNRYFMYEYNQGLQEIDEDYLKEMFKREVLSYVPNSIERIPFSINGYTKKKETL